MVDPHLWVISLSSNWLGNHLGQQPLFQQPYLHFLVLEILEVLQSQKFQLSENLVMKIYQRYDITRFPMKSFRWRLTINFGCRTKRLLLKVENQKHWRGWENQLLTRCLLMFAVQALAPSYRITLIFSFSGTLSLAFFTNSLIKWTARFRTGMGCKFWETQG